MTTLLEKAIAEATSLPAKEQDFVAAIVLKSIEDSKEWDAKFAESKDVLEELYDEAMADYKSGRTAPFDYDK